MKAICIIPAKKLSKRMPNKNIKSFLGLPMIAHVIKNIKKSRCFGEIIVSTDSKKIKKISEMHGAKVPFLRGKKLSNEYTTTNDVIIDVIKKLEKNRRLDLICCIYPTSIFASPLVIRKAFKILKNKKVKFVFSAKKYEHPMQRGFYIDKRKITLLKKKNLNKRTQDFRDLYYDAGQIYLSNYKNFLNKKNQFNLPSKPIIFKRFQSIDIDNKENFLVAKKIILNNLHLY
tara:strand:- start:394 stop:1083 length:690 start_codon:yes stop_codon:yes gene_type:complete